MPLYIGSFYRPPTHGQNHIEVLDQLSLSLDKLTQRKKLPDIFLTGDFNLPDIDWETGMISNKPQYGNQVNQKILEITADQI